MTIKELSQLYYLNREIEMDRQRLRELEEKVVPGAQAITGMPHAKGVFDVVGNYAVQIADLRAIIEEKQKRCLFERERLEEYISAVPDSFIRQIFTYRFVNGLPWEQVAVFIGGGNTADSVRMTCYRFIRKNQ